MLNYLKKLPANHFVLNQDITFLRSIHDMLQYISDPKFSTASISWVSKRLPPGKLSCFCTLMLIGFEISEKISHSLENYGC